MSTSYPGVYRGRVSNNQDPEHLNRVRATVPELLGNNALEWCWPTSPSTGAPAVGSTVWVLFEGGNIDRPVYISH